MTKLNKKAKRQIIYLAIGLLGFSFLALFMKQVISFVFVVAFMIIASLSKLYIRFTNMPLGFELITPAVILFAYRISPFFAIFSAIIMLFLSSLFMGRFDFPGIMMETIIFIIVSIVAFALSSVSFVVVAIALIVLRNLIIFPTAILLLGRNPAQIGFAVIVNMIINIMLMLSIGNVLVGMV